MQNYSLLCGNAFEEQLNVTSVVMYSSSTLFRSPIFLHLTHIQSKFIKSFKRTTVNAFSGANVEYRLHIKYVYNNKTMQAGRDRFVNGKYRLRNGKMTAHQSTNFAYAIHTTIWKM